mgnify:CR=1 FL=1
MSKNKKPAELSVADKQAQSVLKMQQWIQSVDNAERRHVGTWYNIPEGFEEWHFVRLGMRGVQNAEALSWQMQQMGYVPAPPGVMCAGFETDGEAGLYLCIPKQAWHVLKERKNRAQSQLDSSVKGALQSAMGGLQTALGPGSEITVTGGTTQGTGGDILDAIRSGKLSDRVA